ncbi:hypothetical protein QE429_000251 [Bacillus sp. SORGH_AS 510]|nr:hypothetical protein [Bacillus sp. SORGH_AS_0510]MDQ1143424.1 hypothetical protein [Bacillus sp. SORGH_AS_0510]
MEKDKKNVEKGNESLNLFIDKLALIIIDTLLDECKGLDNGNCFKTA